ncbi:guanitoxin biosynthesis heme-dependent pre-guanitoxin N-hydroxylase GntA [Qipengyuania sp. JC766]|uniref:guanitoxin biosynthesis heme-dependent pre-guanitoxin N-hydroxylase GntA n=1 Tax=Qipengyuania sp. JC766 TaxID=3232139 RepID=UPI0034573EE8
MDILADDPATQDNTDEALAERFRAFVSDTAFPCVGAKSALARGSLEIAVAQDIESAWDDLRIHRRLLDWSWRYRDEQDGLRSLVFLFRAGRSLDEEAFERALWDRLQSMTDKDVWLGQSPDPAVSAQPADPHFGLSFGGQGYFVVGLHPHASRPARRFEVPAMVFNLHDQFERLRAEGRYERMREVIIARDTDLAGTPNPMLARHGEASEARQYSGRQVGEDWRCPFTGRAPASQETP